MNRPHPDAKCWSSRAAKRFCGAPRSAHVGEQQRCPDADPSKAHHVFKDHGTIAGRASTSMRESDAIVLSEVVRRLLAGEDLSRYARGNALALGRLAKTARSLLTRIAEQRARVAAEAPQAASSEAEAAE